LKVDTYHHAGSDSSCAKRPQTLVVQVEDLALTRLEEAVRGHDAQLPARGQIHVARLVIRQEVAFIVT